MIIAKFSDPDKAYEIHLLKMRIFKKEYVIKELKKELKQLKIERIKNMINLKTFAKPVDSRIEKQKQLIHDQEKILEGMKKELDRLEKLKAWAEGGEEE